MELHSLHIKILNTLKSSADGMTKHEIEKNIGQKFITAYIDTLRKYGYVEIAGTKMGINKLFIQTEILKIFQHYLSQFIKL